MLDQNDEILGHFFSPRNQGVLEDANAVGTAGSAAMGESVRLMLRIDPLSRIIEAARFVATGGSDAVACCSALTGLLTGQTLEAARQLTARDIETCLGALPGERFPAAQLGQEALHEALTGFSGAPAPVKLLAPKHESRPKVEREVPLSPEEEARAIAEVIDQVRPTLRADGGDVVLLSVQGSHVRVHLTGNCSGCQLAALTLGGLQKRLADALGRPIRVIPESKPLVTIGGPRP